MTYEQALISAKNGNAVIFYGAGFCRGLTSALGKELPTGKGLAEILCQEIDMDNVDDLKDAAQYYLRDFYASFGFVENSEPFYEDDIKHVNMILKF